MIVDKAIFLSTLQTGDFNLLNVVNTHATAADAANSFSSICFMIFYCSFASSFVKRPLLLFYLVAAASNSFHQQFSSFFSGQVVFFCFIRLFGLTSGVFICFSKQFFLLLCHLNDGLLLLAALAPLVDYNNISCVRVCESVLSTLLRRRHRRLFCGFCEIIFSVQCMTFLLTCVVALILVFVVFFVFFFFVCVFCYIKTLWFYSHKLCWCYFIISYSCCDQQIQFFMPMFFVVVD